MAVYAARRLVIMREFGTVQSRTKVEHWPKLSPAAPTDREPLPATLGE